MNNWEWIGLGIDAGLVALFYALYKTYNSRAQQIKEAKELNINDMLLKQILHDGQTVEYGCIQGKVLADSFLPSRYGNDVGVIRTLSMVEHKSTRENGFWRDIKRTIQNTVDKIPFHLSSADDSSLKVHVMEPSDAHYVMDDLTVTYSAFKPNEQSIIGKGVDRFFGDVTKGFEETEKMLPLGTYLLGMGRLTAENGKVILEAPTNGSLYILTTQTKKQLLNSVSRTSRIFQAFVGIFGVLGTGFLVFIIYSKIRNFLDGRRDDNMFARMRANMRNRFGRNNAAAGGQGGANAELSHAGGGDDALEERSCVICLSHPRNVVLLECGHICVCISCAQAIPRPRKCPVCRGHIERIMSLYNA